MVVFALIFFSLFAGLNFYLGKRISFWLHTLMPEMNFRIFWAAYIVLSVIPIVAQMIHQSTWTRPLKLFGNYWLGVFVYLLLALLIVDMVRLLLKLIKKMPVFFTTSKGIGLIGAGVVFIVAIILIYGTIHAKQIQIAKYQVDIAKESSMEKMRIVMISDIHLGNVITANQVEKIVRKINEQKPDLVVLTGDIFDGDYDAVAEPERIAQSFSSIQATYGSYAVFGNHDAGKDYDKMVTFMDGTNIQLLQDETIQIADGLTLVGRKDPSPIGNRDGERKPIEELVSNVDASNSIIILDHQPSGIDDARAINADMLLSGHTHRGQLYPFHYAVQLAFEVYYGHQKDGNLNTIVSSGVGTWGPPLRVGSDSEITSIDVHFNGK